MCNDCNCMCYDDTREYDVKIDKLIKALTEIKEVADKCWCDHGYPGSCGCGKRCGDIAEDALDKRFEP